jgi:hypothetical protein
MPNYFFSTAAAAVGSILAGYSIEAMRGDYGMIFVVTPITLVCAFALMLGVWRGERAELMPTAALVE